MYYIFPVRKRRQKIAFSHLLRRNRDSNASIHGPNRYDWPTQSIMTFMSEFMSLSYHAFEIAECPEFGIDRLVIRTGVITAKGALALIEWK